MGKCQVIIFLSFFLFHFPKTKEYVSKGEKDKNKNEKESFEHISIQLLFQLLPHIFFEFIFSTSLEMNANARVFMIHII
jgi:hypothetical protein